MTRIAKADYLNMHVSISFTVSNGFGKMLIL